VTAPNVPTSPSAEVAASEPVPVRTLPPSPFRPPILVPLLPYADVAAQYGVLVDRRPSGGMTITVPPWPWYRRPAVFYGAAVMLVVQVVPAVFMAVNDRVWAPLIAFGAIGIIIACIWFAMYSISKHMPSVKVDNFAARFDVERDTLNVWWRRPGETHRSYPARGRPADVTHFSCRRDEVVSIRGDLFRMGLTIRVHRRFIAEMLHERPKVLRVWIARALCEALRIDDASSPRST
jgi:hypothetical protein